MIPAKRIFLTAFALASAILPGITAEGAEHSQEVKRLLAVAKEKGERELDLVWSATSLGGSDGARKFEAVFNRMYGLNARLNFTPGPTMTEMAGKVTQEATAGRKASTDILVGTESHFGALLERNVLEEYDYSRLSPRIKKDLVAVKNIGVEFYTIVPGITYNTNSVRPGDIPRRLEDVLHPKWKGKIASTQNAAIFDRVVYRPEWGVEKMRAFIVKLAGHVAGLIRASENERVISGEFVMLVLDGGGHQVRKQLAKGAPLGHVIPEDAGTVTFGYMGVPRNSAHQNLAKLFINMVMSEEGQRVVFETHFTDHHELPGSQSASALADLKAKRADLLRTDIHFGIKHPEMANLSDEFRKILRVKRGG
jgi:iron(III) transport system substrate-binding protein